MHLLNRYGPTAARAAGRPGRETRPNSVTIDIHSHVMVPEAAAFVQRFLAQLNDKKREIFVLAVLEEMNVVEVAAALSIPLNTAYTRLRSVRSLESLPHGAHVLRPGRGVSPQSTHRPLRRRCL